jgi:hypothetical protein
MAGTISIDHRILRVLCSLSWCRTRTTFSGEDSFEEGTSLRGTAKKPSSSAIDGTGEVLCFERNGVGDGGGVNMVNGGCKNERRKVGVLKSVYQWEQEV